MRPYAYDHKVLLNLLLSQDQKLIATLQSACANVGISPTLCSGHSETTALLARRKFYGVIVDGTEPHIANEVLSAVQASSSSRRAVSIAVSDDPTRLEGGTFVLRKPVGVDLAMRTLRAAKGPMLNEFSRYFRHQMQQPIRITRDLGGELKATTINISQRGMGIQLPSGKALIAAGDAIRALLTLPGGDACIEAKGKIVWIDSRGRAGISCEGHSPCDRHQLESGLRPSVLLR
jgi:hypothetical protein